MEMSTGLRHSMRINHAKARASVLDNTLSILPIYTRYLSNVNTKEREREMNSDFVATLAPMLAPNKIVGMDIPFEDIHYPKLCSTKYNGIRGIILGGRIVSRTGKSFIETKQMNPYVARLFDEIVDYAKEHRIVLDGEFHSNSHNTVGQTRSILAGTIPMPDDFMFKCFYSIPYPIWNTAQVGTMKQNLSIPLNLPRYHRVSQKTIDSDSEFQHLIETFKGMNIEGFMLLDPDARYKHNPRCTITEQILLKYKYYADEEDAKVIGLTSRRERRAGVPKKVGTFGKAEQVYTKASFEDTEIAGCIMAEIEVYPDDGVPIPETQVIYTPFPVGWTHAMREQAYLHYGTGSAYDIKGTWITFRRLYCEDRDKPIAIKNVQFRDSKD